MSATANRRMWRWVTPLFCVFWGIVYLAAWWAGGELTTGVVALAVMVGVGALLIPLSRHSETLRRLLDREDERLVNIDLRATAVAGWIVIVAVLIAFVVEIAEGHSGAPYYWLAALAGTGYLGALAWLRWRR